MSDNESSDTSDEEYVPNDVIESESQEIDDSNESDVDECQEKTTEIKSPEPEISEEQKLKNEKELWESFKNDVEDENKISKIENQKEIEDVKTNVSIAGVSNTKRPGLSLKTIMSGLGPNKKPKLNMLEKSKQDWEKFVTAEGIKDDLKIFNRGKQGFLERKAFEARTEMNQFEREKNLRLQAKPKK